MKIIWCYFTIQHTVEWGRMLIPHEDNWSYYRFNILFRLSVWRNTTNAIFFLVGQRPGWTEHALQTSTNTLMTGMACDPAWGAWIHQHSSFKNASLAQIATFHQASTLAANRSTTSHQRCLWPNPTQTLQSMRSSMSCMWSHPEMRMSDLLSGFPNIFHRTQRSLRIS
jgi:hypothetical protein